jgi:hypothetical protein
MKRIVRSVVVISNQKRAAKDAFLKQFNPA